MKKLLMCLVCLFMVSCFYKATVAPAIDMPEDYNGPQLYPIIVEKVDVSKPEKILAAALPLMQKVCRGDQPIIVFAQEKTEGRHVNLIMVFGCKGEMKLKLKSDKHGFGNKNNLRGI